MQEITGAKPVRDTIFSALKALSAMHSLGKRISPVHYSSRSEQFHLRHPACRTWEVHSRVRAPFLAVGKDRSRASAQVGFISPPCPGQHRRLRGTGMPATLPPCSSLRISFVKNFCRSITGWRLHRWARVVQEQRHDVESVASAGATPVASTIPACKH